MKNPAYKNILLAVELNLRNDHPLLEKAQYFAKKTGAKISLVHAIEHIGSFSAASYGVISIDAEIEKILLDRAKKEMEKYGKKIGVSKTNQSISIGSAKFVVLEEASKRKTDLIIVGSRGREGMRMLLGSTANAVLHGAKCDVLAVRIK